MSFRFPSATNSYLAMPTGQVTSYILDPSEFALNNYCQAIDAPKMLGLWYKIDRDTPARVVTDAESDWVDGADRPQVNAGGLQFDTVAFECRRKSYGYSLGDLAIEGAADVLPLVAMNAAAEMQIAMTLRAWRIATLLEDSDNWLGNTDTANSLNGGAGTWDTASDVSGDSHYNAIRKALTAAAIRVNLATRGKVRAKDLVLVLSPPAATAISNSPEMHAYLKHGPFSKAQIEGDNNANRGFGLPESIYGYPIVIEDCVRVSDRRNADGTPSVLGGYVKSDSTAWLLSRKGGLHGQYGTMNWSTIQMYFHGPRAAVEVYNDPEHKKMRGYVSENFIEVMAAPEAGMLITGIL